LLCCAFCDLCFAECCDGDLTYLVTQHGMRCWPDLFADVQHVTTTSSTSFLAHNVHVSSKHSKKSTLPLYHTKARYHC